MQSLGFKKDDPSFFMRTLICEFLRLLYNVLCLKLPCNRKIGMLVSVRRLDLESHVHGGS